MEIYINGNKIDYMPTLPLTWGSLFQKLLQENDFIKESHGIVQIKLDGVDSMNVMTEQMEKTVDGDIEKMEIFTRDSISITKEGLGKVGDLIESMKTETAGAAKLYREDNLTEASSKVAKVMEAFKPMVTFIQSVGISFTMNFDEIMFNQTTSLREKIEFFLETLGELVSAQQKKDYATVADYLEYQFIEDLSDWNTIVALLLKEVEAGEKMQ